MASHAGFRADLAGPALGILGDDGPGAVVGRHNPPGLIKRTASRASAGPMV